MKVQNCQPLKPVAFNGIKINRVDNKHVKYLDNKIMDIITIDRLTGNGGSGATFTNDYITIASEHKSLLDKIIEAGIKWVKDVKQ